jgi:hypothetical protein
LRWRTFAPQRRAKSGAEAEITLSATSFCTSAELLRNFCNTCRHWLHAAAAPAFDLTETRVRQERHERADVITN